jgi:glutamine synthetase
MKVSKRIIPCRIRWKKRKKIDTLPASLLQALSEFKKSKLMKEVLGDHVFNALISNKTVEWDRFRVAVTDFEIKNYLPVL